MQLHPENICLNSWRSLSYFCFKNPPWFLLSYALLCLYTSWAHQMAATCISDHYGQIITKYAYCDFPSAQWRALRPYFWTQGPANVKSASCGLGCHGNAIITLLLPILLHRHIQTCNWTNYLSSWMWVPCINFDSCWLDNKSVTVVGISWFCNSSSVSFEEWIQTIDLMKMSHTDAQTCT